MLVLVKPKGEGKEIKRI